MENKNITTIATDLQFMVTVFYSLRGHYWLNNTDDNTVQEEIRNLSTLCNFIRQHLSQQWTQSQQQQPRTRVA